MALPRTIVWLPRRPPHPLEATGSIALICRVRSNAGTCGCSDNLSKKQVQGIDQQLLPARSRFAGNLHQFRGLRRRGWRGRSEGMTGRHTRRMPASTLRPLNHNRRQSRIRQGAKASREPRRRMLLHHRSNGQRRETLTSFKPTLRPPDLGHAFASYGPSRYRKLRHRRWRAAQIRRTRALGLAEADTAMHADNESAVRPSEGPGGTSRIGQLAVLVFLLLGLPGAGILAWLVMKADNARGEQLAGNHHLRSNPADDRGHNNKRRTGGLDDQREADWIDDVLARFAEHPTTSVRNAALTSTAPVQRSSEVTEAVLRDVMIALRNKVAAQCDSSSYAVAGR